MKVKLIILTFLLISIVSLGSELNPVVIKMACGSVGKEVSNNKYLIKVFEKKHPSIKVELNVISNSSQDKLGYYLQLFEAKSGDVDILLLDNIWIGDLAENLLTLNNYNIEESLVDVFPGYLENITFENNTVAIPWYVDAPFLYYRKDLLEKYNLDIPKTWKELTTSAYKIQQGERDKGNSDFVGYLWPDTTYEGLTCCALEWLASNNAGTIINNNEITVDNQNAIDALNFAASWIRTISTKGVLTMREEQVRNSFQSGNAAFMRNWPYAYTLCESEDSHVKGKVGITSLPAGKSGESAATLGGGSLAVNKYSEHPDEAVEFIKFMTSSEAESYLALQGQQSPALMSLFKDETILERNPFYPELFKAVIDGVNRPSTVTGDDYNRVSEAFYTTVYSVVAENKNAETALADLAKELNKITGLKIKQETIKTK